MSKRFFAEVIFWMHVLIVGFWYALFLVPTSLWADKITFHFYFTLGVVGHQFLWGAVIIPWTRKYRMVCVLTTPMQIFRGHSIADPKNYDHSFTLEFLKRLGISVPHKASTILTFIILTVVTIQFFFFR